MRLKFFLYLLELSFLCGHLIYLGLFLDTHKCEKASHKGQSLTTHKVPREVTLTEAESGCQELSEREQEVIVK